MADVYIFQGPEKVNLNADDRIAIGDEEDKDVDGLPKRKYAKVRNFQNPTFRKLVIEGDSISNGVSEDWPAWISINPYFAQAEQINFAVGGRTAVTMAAQYPNDAGSVKPTIYTNDDYWFSIYGGINDLAGDASATTIYNALKSSWSQAKADNYKVIAYTVMTSTDLTGPQETQRLALNQLILSDTTLYDIVVRPDLVLSPVTTPALFADGTHPNEAGSKLFADIINRTFTHKPYLIFPDGDVGQAVIKWVLRLNPAGETTEILGEAPVQRIINTETTTAFGYEFWSNDNLEAFIKHVPNTGIFQTKIGRNANWGASYLTTIDERDVFNMNKKSIRCLGSDNVFGLPKLTTTQRDALTDLSAGDAIYNTTTNKHQGYNGSTWNDFY